MKPNTNFEIKPEELKKTQKLVYEKVQKALNKQKPTFADLKNLVTNKSLPKSQRLSREELKVAFLYFNNQATPPGSVPKYEWDPDFPLENINSLIFTKNKVELLIGEYDRLQNTSSSLIPIKGISKTMQAKLRNLHIYDAPTLLAKGYKYNKRVELAAKLDIDIKLVNLWVKQADLWRVEEMTTDMAYLLTQIGVRSVEDLARVDVDKAYPILQSFNASQIDFVLIEKASLENIINNAIFLLNLSVSPININGIKEDIIKISNANSSSLSNATPILNQILQKLNDISSYPTGIETLDEPPLYLFKENDKDEETYNIESINKLLNEVLGFLDGIEYNLPLPRTVSGSVFIKKIDEPYKNKKCLPGVLVEIDGIVSPTEDKTELNKKPRCYTDGNGKFIISMPDRYSIKEALTITVSEGSQKQKFLISASDFINSVPEQKTLNEFLLLDSMGDSIEILSAKIKELEEHRNNLETLKQKNNSRSSNAEETQKLEEIDEALNGDDSKGIAGLKNQRNEIKKQFEQVKNKLTKKYNTNDIKIAFERFISSAVALNAEINPNNYDKEKENDGFVIIKEIFERRRKDTPKALPSVKLMGDGENTIKLPTDTSPSRIFSYQMLQRLKEPMIHPRAKGAGKNGRLALNRPLDVEDFKQKMYEDPDNYPQMSSLGLGYVLNMHQAWVPDGFALGSLLYSLILAPDEEQRLIVRENKQQYTVEDRASGLDMVSENYALSQEDDTTAAFNYAVDQMSKGNSDYQYSTKTLSFGVAGGVAGIFPGGAAAIGAAFGYSKASGKGSSSSSQSNSHKEASSAANNFQHNIKSASDRISQSKRISISTATSEVSDSVATKIIANHNHSHAMTVQYWEVMRRYKLETCIDGVDLVLFVPLKPIRFLPKGQKFNYDTQNISSFNQKSLNDRYGALLKHENSLRYALPYRYRTGLSLIKKYSSYPRWEMEQKNNSKSNILTFEFNANLLEFDNISVRLELKNGKGSIAGYTNYVRKTFEKQIQTTYELKDTIRDIRNNPNRHNVRVSCTFNLPADIIKDDFAYIKINHSFKEFSYELPLNNKSFTEEQLKAFNNLKKKLDHLGKDNKDSADDKIDIEHYRSQLPEAYRNYPYRNRITLSASELNNLGSPTISDIKVIFDGSSLNTALSNSSLNYLTTVGISTATQTLRYSEFQQMEALLHHVATDTLFYSQIVWNGLTCDEKAMLLEQYTVNMDFEAIETNLDKNDWDANETKPKQTIDIPLLNCVNVKKMLGFYGNCMILPFTYPKELAKQLGYTADELQDSIYKYHTNSFRVPTTTISLPTNGMIGEAVLGETNVSEEIDITRFWNWQDSPIDKMNIDAGYLNSTDYLTGKNTKDISSLNLQSATPATPVTVADLVTALVNKQAPKFDNITGLDQLKDVLNEGTRSAATGRDKAITTASEMASKALEYAFKAEELSSKQKEGNNNSDSKDVKKSNNGGGNNGGKTNDDTNLPQNPKDPNNPNNPTNTGIQKENPANPNKDATTEVNNQEKDSTESKETETIPPQPETQPNTPKDNPNANEAEMANLKTKIETILQEASTMTPAELYKKYMGKEYDTSTVGNEAKVVSGNDYDTLKALIGLMLNEDNKKQ